jgi:hypothetical protein
MARGRRFTKFIPYFSIFNLYNGVLSLLKDFGVKGLWIFHDGDV